MARRAGLSGAGLLLAGAFLSPYVVMFLTAVKPGSELRTSPPRLLPVRWRFENGSGMRIPLCRRCR